MTSIRHNFDPRQGGLLEGRCTHCGLTLQEHDTDPYQRLEEVRRKADENLAAARQTDQRSALEAVLHREPTEIIERDTVGKSIKLRDRDIAAESVIGRDRAPSTDSINSPERDTPPDISMLRDRDTPLDSTFAANRDSPSDSIILRDRDTLPESTPEADRDNAGKSTKHRDRDKYPDSTSDDDRASRSESTEKGERDNADDSAKDNDRDQLTTKEAELEFLTAASNFYRELIKGENSDAYRWSRLAFITAARSYLIA